MKKGICFLIIAISFSVAGCKERAAAKKDVLRPVMTMEVVEGGSSGQWLFPVTAEDAL